MNDDSVVSSLLRRHCEERSNPETLDTEWIASQARNDDAPC
jgi:hypothetical protein